MLQPRCNAYGHVATRPNQSAARCSHAAGARASRRVPPAACAPAGCKHRVRPVTAPSAADRAAPRAPHATRYSDWPPVRACTHRMHARIPQARVRRSTTGRGLVVGLRYAWEQLGLLHHQRNDLKRAARYPARACVAHSRAARAAALCGRAARGRHRRHGSLYRAALRSEVRLSAGTRLFYYLGNALLGLAEWDAAASSYHEVHDPRGSRALQRSATHCNVARRVAT